MWFANIFSMQFVVNSTKFTCHIIVCCHSFLFYYILYEPATSFPCVFITECIFWSLFHHFTQFILSSVFSDWLCFLIFMHLCLLHLYNKNHLYLFVSTEKSDSAPQGKVQNPNVDSYITSLPWCHSQVGSQQGKQTKKVLRLGTCTVRRSVRKNVKSWKKSNFKDNLVIGEGTETTVCFKNKTCHKDIRMLVGDMDLEKEERCTENPINPIPVSLTTWWRISDML